MEFALEARVQRFIETYSFPFDEAATHHLRSMLHEAGYSRVGRTPLYHRLGIRHGEPTIDIFDNDLLRNGTRECAYLETDNMDTVWNYIQARPVSAFSAAKALRNAGGLAGINAVVGLLFTKAIDVGLDISTLGRGAGFYDAYAAKIAMVLGALGGVVGGGIGFVDYLLKQKRNDRFYERYESQMTFGIPAVKKALLP